MGIFFRYLHMEWVKTKHLRFSNIHLLIPIIMALIFIAYYSYSPWDCTVKVEMYFQLLGIGSPILISLVTVILAEQEATAGKFLGLLQLEKKTIAFFSKAMLLIFWGAVAVFFACGLFGIGFYYILRQTDIDFSFYWTMAVILLCCNIFIYGFHMFLSFRYNKGVSIGIGIIESLVSALMLTGIGKNIWIYIPCSWGVGTVNNLFQTRYVSYSKMDIYQCVQALSLCAIATLILYIGLGIWFDRWKGRDYD